MKLLLLTCLALVACTIEAAPKKPMDDDLVGRLVHGMVQGLGMTVHEMRGESDENLLNPILDMVDPMNWMMKMMPGMFGYKMHKLTMAHCWMKCTGNRFDCPNGNNTDWGDRSNPCRTCFLECSACADEHHVMDALMKEHYKKMAMSKLFGKDMDEMSEMHEDGDGMHMSDEDKMGVDDYLKIGCQRYMPNEQDINNIGDYLMDMKDLPEEKVMMIKEHLMMKMKKSMLIKEMLGEDWMNDVMMM